MAFLTPKSDIERSCIAVENSKMNIIILSQNLNQPALGPVTDDTDRQTFAFPELLSKLKLNKIIFL